MNLIVMKLLVIMKTVIVMIVRIMKIINYSVINNNNFFYKFRLLYIDLTVLALLPFLALNCSESRHTPEASSMRHKQ